MDLRGIIFDLYGTLVYAENPLSFDELSSLLISRGYEVYMQELRAAYLYVIFIEHPREKFQSFKEFFKRVAERLEVGINEDTLREVSELHERTRNKFFPEVLETLEELKKRSLKMALVTSTPRFAFKDIAPILEKYMIIVTSSEAGCVKPNPRIFLKALEHLKLSPIETVSVGDDYSLDIKIPKKLGMKTILVARYKLPLLFAEADIVVKNLKEILDYLQ